MPAGRVRYVQRDEDPRDYRVAFEKIHAVLGFVPERRVPDGIAEVAEALAEGRFPDPFDVRYREHRLRSRSATCASPRTRSPRAADALRSGWLTMGPRTAAFEEAFAQRLGSRHAIAVANGTAALHLAYLAAGIGPGDEVIVPSYTFVATAAAVVAAAPRRCSPTSSAPMTRRSTPRTSRRASRRAPGPSPSCTSRATRPRSTGCAGCATSTASR